MLADLGLYFGLFTTSFLSATLLPGSSEAALAALVLIGKSDPVLLLIAATTGNVLGSLFNWYCGGFLMQFIGRRWFPVSQQHYDKAVGWFAAYGKASLLFSWAPVVGDPLTVVAGALRVPLLQFLVLVSIGKAARYLSIYLALIYWQ
ncbi:MULTISPECIES: YqaA family protein [Pseudovibrio]|uniref:YqaA family protein n=1 Tax=Stappiaceae TaxID=2821832 RepID=UPI00236714ED|nr:MULTISPECIES: YqaA family protein [Pseudovibrio]MDD7909873.1 DedA family protein [Pseudovibrio exalbescens]MDX5592211.1 YqaA family protein [Pseudovibrio sp. SPO723]